VTFVVWDSTNHVGVVFSPGIMGGRRLRNLPVDHRGIPSLLRLSTDLSLPLFAFRTASSTYGIMPGLRRWQA
jgi:hypothetical protein